MFNNDDPRQIYRIHLETTATGNTTPRLVVARSFKGAEIATKVVIENTTCYITHIELVGEALAEIDE